MFKSTFNKKEIVLDLGISGQQLFFSTAFFFFINTVDTAVDAVSKNMRMQICQIAQMCFHLIQEAPHFTIVSSRPSGSNHSTDPKSEKMSLHFH